MTPQAHLIGYDYSVYADLIAIVVMLCLCMLACTVRLVFQKRSCQFIALIWGGFLLLMLLGVFGVSTFIYQQRLDWSDYCSKLVAYYADVISRLDHEKIQPGNPEVFSDWSPPLLSPDQKNTLPPEAESIASAHVDRSILEKLAVPEGLTASWRDFQPVANTLTHLKRRNQWAVAELTQDCHAFDRSTKQILVQWEPVPQATTYRLQWGYYNDEETHWITVYTGSKPSCVLAFPEEKKRFVLTPVKGSLSPYIPTVPEGTSLAFRVRAEDGTPEDDPHFNQIVDTLDFPAMTNVYVGYVYTMRSADQEHGQFIVAPISDANKNGLIDVNEMPNDIGELYPKTPIFRHVFKYKERAMDFEILEDPWGKWFIIAEPIWTQNNEMEGLLGMDFRADVLLRVMFYERLYPLCLFVLVMFVYFWAVLIVNRLQIKAAQVSHLADELQHTVSELTDAKQLAEKALQVKTLFLTNMSHEFRTPLNAILGFIGILERSSYRCVAEERTMCQEAIKQVKDNGKSLLKLVDNILGVAAMDGTQTPRLSFTPVHLRNLVNEVAEKMYGWAEYKSLTLTVEESPDAPEWIKSDPAHIRQVLTLLVDNAIKFTPEGSVVIRYGLSPGQESPRLPMFYVSVSDTGIGINTKQLQSVFKPFSQSDPTSTREYGGIGIGLAVARQAAEILNGTISVESEIGEGTTFTFTFPGQITEPAPQEGSITQSSMMLQEIKSMKDVKPTQSSTLLASGVLSSLGGCRILVVDDTRVNQAVIVNQMEKLGAIVETADNGQIGIEKIKEAETRDKPFDVILMDMQMPVLDGYDATRHLRANGYSKPIIAVTAHALPEDREKTLEAGCDDHITKPVNFAQLTGMIKAFWQ